MLDFATFTHVQKQNSRKCVDETGNTPIAMAVNSEVLKIGQ